LNFTASSSTLHIRKIYINAMMNSNKSFEEQRNDYCDW